MEGKKVAEREKKTIKKQEYIEQVRNCRGATDGKPHTYYHLNI